MAHACTCSTHSRLQGKAARLALLQQLVLLSLPPRRALRVAKTAQGEASTEESPSGSGHESKASLSSLGPYGYGDVDSGPGEAEWKSAEPMEEDEDDLDGGGGAERPRKPGSVRRWWKVL